MVHDVFISYSREDKPVADAVCAKLEANQTRCWIAPRDIRPGQDWGEAIIDGINGARIMVLVFSGYANRSPQVLREVERAVNRGLVVIPMRIEAVLPERALEYFLSSPHWLDAVDPPLEKYLEHLVDTVHSVLDQPRNPDRNRPPDVARRRGSGARKPLPLLAGAAIALIALVAGILWWRHHHDDSHSVTPTSTTAPFSLVSILSTTTTTLLATTTTPATTTTAPLNTCTTEACRTLLNAMPFNASNCTITPESTLRSISAVAKVACNNPLDPTMTETAIAFSSLDALTNAYNADVATVGLRTGTGPDCSTGPCELGWQLGSNPTTVGRLFAVYNPTSLADARNRQLLEWYDTRTLRLLWITLNTSTAKFGTAYTYFQQYR